MTGWPNRDGGGHHKHVIGPHVSRVSRACIASEMVGGVVRGETMHK